MLVQVISFLSVFLFFEASSVVSRILPVVFECSQHCNRSISGLFMKVIKHLILLCCTFDVVLTHFSQVYVQLRLPDMGILSRCESPWRLECITASEVAVWALQSETGRLVVRAGLKHCPIGLDWVEIEFVY